MSDLDRYLDNYLAGTELLDCQGRVEHALTLLVDGRVRIRRGTTTIVVDPASGHVNPPGAILPDHVLHAVGELAGRPAPTHHHHSHGSRH
ncbi:MAG TPA: hypothetical protein VNQ73_12400 [Ilumatobacter sp.]|nr:hypothetical protein [Ilumatobacter sp.]